MNSLPFFLLAAALALSAAPAFAQKKKAARSADASAPFAAVFQGDVTAVSVVGRVEQHPTA